MTAWTTPHGSSDTRERAPGTISAIRKANTWRSTIVVCFMLALIAPFIFYLGTLRLSVYRVVLIVLLLPALFSWATGHSGKIRLIDFLILMHVFWAVAALLFAHGFDQGTEFAGMYIIETLGPFFLARWCIRDEVDFRHFVNAWLYCIAALLPFALIESLTSDPILLSLLRRFVPVGPNVPMESRWGLDRAQAIFEHPILFGSFCAGALGVGFYLPYGRRIGMQRLVRSVVVLAATFFSLSVGAWVGFYLQGALILWDFTTRWLVRRWAILGALALLAYITVDALSNRTPFHVFIDYLTFSQGNAYNRILIWDFGTASVANYPIMGIGLGEWERPWWMHASMDNFWLVFAVRYGLPGFATFAAAVALICWQLGRKELSESAAACRFGLLVTIGGLSIAGATVHYWNATYCLFTFLLGSGMWMLDAPSRTSASAEAQLPEETTVPPRDLLPIRYRDGASPL